MALRSAIIEAHYPHQARGVWSYVADYDAEMWAALHRGCDPRTEYRVILDAARGDAR